MDFSALLSQLRKLAEERKSDNEPELSTVYYCECFIKVLQRVEKLISSYEDNIVFLWICLSNLAETFKNLAKCFARDELCQFIFLLCVKMVLNVKWQLLPEEHEAKQNFSVTVASTHEQLKETGFTKFGILLNVMETHWSHPVLGQIMSGESCDTEEAQNYINSEDPVVLKLRVDIMIEENCEEFALNLCYGCLKHSVLKDDINMRQTQLVLLHKLNKLRKLQDVCEQLPCSLGIQIVQHLEQSEANQDLCVRLAQTFLVQDWLRPDHYRCTDDLLKLWIRHQYLVDQDRENFKTSIWAVAKVSIETEQIGSLIDALKKECGDTFMQLYTDLLIYAINLDKGCMEQQMLQGNLDGVRTHQRAIASTCKRLADMYKSSDPKVARISALTAFSLDPSREILHIVENQYQHYDGSKHVLKDPLKCCEECKKTGYRSSRCKSWTENPETKVNVATIYEVERLMNMMRPYYLNPELPWEHLQHVCKKFMGEKQQSPEPSQIVTSTMETQPSAEQTCGSQLLILSEENKMTRVAKNVPFVWQQSVVKASSAHESAMSESQEVLAEQRCPKSVTKSHTVVKAVSPGDIDRSKTQSSTAVNGAPSKHYSIPVSELKKIQLSKHFVSSSVSKPSNQSHKQQVSAETKVQCDGKGSLQPPHIHRATALCRAESKQTVGTSTPSELSKLQTKFPGLPLDELSTTPRHQVTQYLKASDLSSAALNMLKAASVGHYTKAASVGHYTVDGKKIYTLETKKQSQMATETSFVLPGAKSSQAAKLAIQQDVLKQKPPHMKHAAVVRILTGNKTDEKPEQQQTVSTPVSENCTKFWSVARQPNNSCATVSSMKSVGHGQSIAKKNPTKVQLMAQVSAVNHPTATTAVTMSTAISKVAMTSPSSSTTPKTVTFNKIPLTKFKNSLKQSHNMYSKIAGVSPKPTSGVATTTATGVQYSKSSVLSHLGECRQLYVKPATIPKTTSKSIKAKTLTNQTQSNTTVTYQKTLSQSTKQAIAAKPLASKPNVHTKTKSYNTVFASPGQTRVLPQLGGRLFPSNVNVATSTVNASQGSTIVLPHFRSLTTSQLATLASLQTNITTVPLIAEPRPQNTIQLSPVLGLQSKSFHDSSVSNAQVSSQIPSSMMAGLQLRGNQVTENMQLSEASVGQPLVNSTMQQNILVVANNSQSVHIPSSSTSAVQARSSLMQPNIDLTNLTVSGVNYPAMPGSNYAFVGQIQNSGGTSQVVIAPAVDTNVHATQLVHNTDVVLSEMSSYVQPAQAVTSFSVGSQITTQAATMVPKSSINQAAYNSVAWPSIQTQGILSVPAQDSCAGSVMDQLITQMLAESNVTQDQLSLKQMAMGKTAIQQMLTTRIPVQPMTAVQTPAQPMMAFQTPAQPMMAFQTPAQPMMAFQTPAQLIAAVQTPAQPIAAIQTPAQPMAAIQSPAQPIAAVQTPTQPMAAIQTPAQPMTAIQTPAHPMTAIQIPAHPMTAIWTPAQPIAAIQTPAQPIAAVQTPTQPMIAIQTPAQPMTAIQTPAQPMAAIQTPAQPMTAIQTPTQPIAAIQTPAHPMTAIQTPAQKMATTRMFAEQMTRTQTPVQQMVREQTVSQQIGADNTFANNLFEQSILDVFDKTLTNDELSEVANALHLGQDINVAIPAVPTHVNMRAEQAAELYHSAVSSPLRQFVPSVAAYEQIASEVDSSSIVTLNENLLHSAENVSQTSIAVSSVVANVLQPTGNFSQPLVCVSESSKHVLQGMDISSSAVSDLRVTDQAHTSKLGNLLSMSGLFSQPSKATNANTLLADNRDTHSMSTGHHISPVSAPSAGTHLRKSQQITSEQDTLQRESSKHLDQVTCRRNCLDSQQSLLRSYLSQTLELKKNQHNEVSQVASTLLKQTKSVDSILCESDNKFSSESNIKECYRQLNQPLNSHVDNNKHNKEEYRHKVLREEIISLNDQKSVSNVVAEFADSSKLNVKQTVEPVPLQYEHSSKIDKDTRTQVSRPVLADRLLAKDQGSCHGVAAKEQAHTITCDEHGATSNKQYAQLKLGEVNILSSESLVIGDITLSGCTKQCAAATLDAAKTSGIKKDNKQHDANMSCLHKSELSLSSLSDVSELQDFSGIGYFKENVVDTVLVEGNKDIDNGLEVDTQNNSSQQVNESMMSCDSDTSKVSVESVSQQKIENEFSVKVGTTAVEEVNGGECLSEHDNILNATWTQDKETLNHVLHLTKIPSVCDTGTEQVHKSDVGQAKLPGLLNIQKSVPAATVILSMNSADNENRLELSAINQSTEHQQVSSNEASESDGAIQNLPSEHPVKEKPSNTESIPEDVTLRRSGSRDALPGKTFMRKYMLGPSSYHYAKTIKQMSQGSSQRTRSSSLDKSRVTAQVIENTLKALKNSGRTSPYAAQKNTPIYQSSLSPQPVRPRVVPTPEKVNQVVQVSPPVPSAQPMKGVIFLKSKKERSPGSNGVTNALQKEDVKKVTMSLQNDAANQCLICHKIFNSVGQLRDHVRYTCRQKSEIKTKDFEFSPIYSCPACTFSSPLKSETERHYRFICKFSSLSDCSCSSILLTFQCKMCNDIFTDRELVLDHMSNSCLKRQINKKADALSGKCLAVKCSANDDKKDIISVFQSSLIAAKCGGSAEVCNVDNGNNAEMDAKCSENDEHTSNDKVPRKHPIDDISNKGKMEDEGKFNDKEKLDVTLKQNNTDEEKVVAGAMIVDDLGCGVNDDHDRMDQDGKIGVTVSGYASNNNIDEKQVKNDRKTEEIVIVNEIINRIQENNHKKTDMILVSSDEKTDEEIKNKTNFNSHCSTKKIEDLDNRQSYSSRKQMDENSVDADRENDIEPNHVTSKISRKFQQNANDRVDIHSKPKLRDKKLLKRNRNWDAENYELETKKKKSEKKLKSKENSRTKMLSRPDTSDKSMTPIFSNVDVSFSDDDTVTCNDCDLNFREHLILVKHLVSKHFKVSIRLPTSSNRRKTFLCLLCHKKFNKGVLYFDHIKDHSEQILTELQKNIKEQISSENETETETEKCDQKGSVLVDVSTQDSEIHTSADSDSVKTSFKAKLLRHPHVNSGVSPVSNSSKKISENMKNDANDRDDNCKIIHKKTRSHASGVSCTDISNTNTSSLLCDNISNRSLRYLSRESHLKDVAVENDADNYSENRSPSKKCKTEKQKSVKKYGARSTSSLGQIDKKQITDKLAKDSKVKSPAKKFMKVDLKINVAMNNEENKNEKKSSERQISRRERITKKNVCQTKTDDTNKRVKSKLSNCTSLRRKTLSVVRRSINRRTSSPSIVCTRSFSSVNELKEMKMTSLHRANISFKNKIHFTSESSMRKGKNKSVKMEINNTEQIDDTGNTNTSKRQGDSSSEKICRQDQAPFQTTVSITVVKEDGNSELEVLPNDNVENQQSDKPATVKKTVVESSNIILGNDGVDSQVCEKTHQSIASDKNNLMDTKIVEEKVDLTRNIVVSSVMDTEQEKEQNKICDNMVNEKNGNQLKVPNVPKRSEQNRTNFLAVIDNQLPLLMTDKSRVEFLDKAIEKSQENSFLDSFMTYIASNCKANSDSSSVSSKSATPVTDVHSPEGKEPEAVPSQEVENKALKELRKQHKTEPFAWEIDDSLQIDLQCQKSKYLCEQYKSFPFTWDLEKSSETSQNTEMMTKENATISDYIPSCIGEKVNQTKKADLSVLEVSKDFVAASDTKCALQATLFRKTDNNNDWMRAFLSHADKSKKRVYDELSNSTDSTSSRQGTSENPLKKLHIVQIEGNHLNKGDEHKLLQVPTENEWLAAFFKSQENLTKAPNIADAMLLPEGKCVVLPGATTAMINPSTTATSSSQPGVIDHSDSSKWMKAFLESQIVSGENVIVPKTDSQESLQIETQDKGSENECHISKVQPEHEIVQSPRTRASTMKNISLKRECKNSKTKQPDQYFYSNVSHDDQSHVSDIENKSTRDSEVSLKTVSQQSRNVVLQDEREKSSDRNSESSEYRNRRSSHRLRSRSQSVTSDWEQSSDHFIDTGDISLKLSLCRSRNSKTCSRDSSCDRQSNCSSLISMNSRDIKCHQGSNVSQQFLCSRSPMSNIECDSEKSNNDSRQIEANLIINSVNCDNEKTSGRTNDDDKKTCGSGANKSKYERSLRSKDVSPSCTGSENRYSNAGRKVDNDMWTKTSLRSHCLQKSSVQIRHIYHDGKIWEIQKGSVKFTTIAPSVCISKEHEPSDVSCKPVSPCQVKLIPLSSIKKPSVDYMGELKVVSQDGKPLPRVKVVRVDCSGKMADTPNNTTGRLASSGGKKEALN